jgi:hypothetical protein
VFPACASPLWPASRDACSAPYGQLCGIFRSRASRASGYLEHLAMRGVTAADVIRVVPRGRYLELSPRYWRAIRAPNRMRGCRSTRSFAKSSAF